MWFEVDISFINLDIMHFPRQFFYISNDVTIQLSSITSQMTSIATHSTFRRARVNGAEIILKYMGLPSNIAQFLRARGLHM